MPRSTRNRMCLITPAAVLGANLFLLVSTVLAEDVGTLVQFQARTPALAAEVNQNFDDLKTAVNSKSTSGFDFSSTDASVSINDTTSPSPTVVASVTLTAPEAGFVVVDFSSYLAVGHTTGADSYVVCALKTDTLSPENAANRLVGSRRFVPVLSGQATATYYPHVDTHAVHPVSAAGSVTFNAVCYRNAASTSGTAIYRTLTATFHADRY